MISKVLSSYAFAISCSVLTQVPLLQLESKMGEYGAWREPNRFLPPYALATPCPVLTSRMRVPAWRLLCVRSPW
eukprot:1025283-Rhodomonas_salina.1